MGDDCVIVDPGSRINKALCFYLAQQQLVPSFIILTHEHFDHCWGVNDLVEKNKIPVVCSELCSECIKSEKRNCSVYYENNAQFIINAKTISVESLGFAMPFAGTTIQFYCTPGHTDASISFNVNGFLFTGDTLLKDIKTVTKLPTGSTSELNKSLEFYKRIQGKGYIVYPGHGGLFALDEYDLNKMK